MKCSVSPCFHCSGWRASAFSPSGLGSSWLNRENSTSGRAPNAAPICDSPDDADTTNTVIRKCTKRCEIDHRIPGREASRVRARLRKQSRTAKRFRSLQFSHETMPAFLVQFEALTLVEGDKIVALLSTGEIG